MISGQWSGFHLTTSVDRELGKEVLVYEYKKFDLSETVLGRSAA